MAKTVKPLDQVVDEATLRLAAGIAVPKELIVESYDAGQFITPRSVQDFLRLFSYKPNWIFGCFPRGYAGFPSPENQNSGIWVKIEMYVENSRPSFKPWDFNRMQDDAHRDLDRYYDDMRYDYRAMIRPPRTPQLLSPRTEVQPVGGDFEVPALISCEAEFFDWLQYAITYVENHERDEWFKVRGLVPFDPHNPQTPMLNPNDWNWEAYKNERRRVRAGKLV